MSMTIESNTNEGNTMVRRYARVVPILGAALEGTSMIYELELRPELSKSHSLCLLGQAAEHYFDRATGRCIGSPNGHFIGWQINQIDLQDINEAVPLSIAATPVADDSDSAQISRLVAFIAEHLPHETGKGDPRHGELPGDTAIRLLKELVERRVNKAKVSTDIMEIERLISLIAKRYYKRANINHGTNRTAIAMMALNEVLENWAASPESAILEGDIKAPKPGTAEDVSGRETLRELYRLTNFAISYCPDRLKGSFRELNAEFGLGADEVAEAIARVIADDKRQRETSFKDMERVIAFIHENCAREFDGCYKMDNERDVDVALRVMKIIFARATATTGASRTMDTNDLSNIVVAQSTNQASSCDINVAATELGRLRMFIVKTLRHEIANDDIHHIESFVDIAIRLMKELSTNRILLNDLLKSRERRVSSLLP
jgi:hypothetical protein